MSSIFAATNEECVFNITFMDTDGSLTMGLRQENMYESTLIESLHRQVKALQKELAEEKRDHEKTKRELEEKDAELYELAFINQKNYEKSIVLKDEVEKAKEEVKRIEKELEEAKKTVEKMAKDLKEAEEKEEIVEEESIESILASYGPAWSTGEDQPAPQTPRFHNPLTVFGWQPPSRPLPPLPKELPLSAGDGEFFCYIITAGREGLYKRTKGVYKLDETAFKQRPVNFYAQPTRRMA
uniref:MBD domain-containing protein n=1 Tax=Caenorhabditis tropicalis TaxID=1561998 RepID=A0A1I7TU13_9PELO